MVLNTKITFNLFLLQPFWSKRLRSPRLWNSKNKILKNNSQLPNFTKSGSKNRSLISNKKCISVINPSLYLFNLPLKIENREICDIRALMFFNCEITCGLTEVPASIYDRKPWADLLTLSATFHNASVTCNRFPWACKIQILFCENGGVDNINIP